MSGVPGKPDQPGKSSPNDGESAQVAKRTSADAEAALRQYERDQARQAAGKVSPAADQPIESKSEAEPPRRWFGLRKPSTLIQSILLGGLTIIIVLSLWWFLTTGDSYEERILSPTILPSPQETFGSFRELWFERALTRNTWATLRRVILGFGFATIVGVPLGVLAGCFAPIRAMLAPLVIFGRNIPIAALIPITMALFLNLDAEGEIQKIMFIFIACVAFIIADAATAISDVSQKYVDTAYTLGATRWQVLIKVLVPLALPSVFNSLRLLFGLAFGYIMLAELITFSETAGGLGYLINSSQKRGMYEHIYLIILIIPIIAMAIDRSLYWIQRQLFPYRYESRGILHWLVRWVLSGWDYIKVQLLGPKPPFDALVVDSATGNQSQNAVSDETPNSDSGGDPA